jgi:hypothetical protein
MLVLLILVQGCGDSQPVSPGRQLTEAIASDRRVDLDPVATTDPVDLVTTYAELCSSRDFTRTVGLLDRDFRFVASFGDGDLPCLDGNGAWSREVEIAIWRNMTDHDYSGSEPPVTHIDMDTSILSVQDLAPGEHRVVADVIAVVLVGPSDGWSTDTRLQFHLVTRRSGTLAIREILELERFEPGSRTSSEPASLAAVKCLYR